MKRTVLAFAFAFLMAVLGAEEVSDRLSSLLPADVATELLDKGIVQSVMYRKPGAVPRLAPALALAGEALSFWEGKEPPFFSESLYLYKKNGQRVGERGSERGDISVILRSLSRLKGVEYYSTSRKKMRTLYEKSYVVDGEKTRKRVDDPVDGSADGLTLLAVQKDLTFGEYLYEYKYRETEDTVAFYSRNLETLSYAIFDLIDPSALRTSLVVHDMGDYLLIYNLTRVSFTAIPGMEAKVKASFTTRAEAVYKWFVSEYEKRK